jgi:hypothetical protein
MDVFLDDNSASNALTFLVELYAWNSGQTGPKLSLGGPTANVATYNVTTLGGAQTILNARIAATSVADAAWQTVTLGKVDLGSGYDFYAWRIGVMGQTNGDGFAFDNRPRRRRGPTYSNGSTDSASMRRPGLRRRSRQRRDCQRSGGMVRHPSRRVQQRTHRLATDGTVATFSHPQNENPPGDLVGSYEWSSDLMTWYAGDGLDGSPGGPFVTFEVETAGTTRTVTATSSAPIGRYFLRAKAELTSSL